MQKIILVAAMTLSGAALAQDNTGSLNQSSQSEWSSSTTTTTTSSSADDSSQSGDSMDSQSSPEMKAWIKSNSSDSSSGNSGFGIGFGRDNDERDDDRPSWSKHQSRPKPEQIEGTYKITASTGQFLCTVNLKASPFFDGYWANTSAGCPELWKVSRWDFQGPSIVLTNSSGDVFASFWPRARDLWVGSATGSGQRLSLSR